MQNEILLVLALIAVYTGLLVWYRLLGEGGLIGFSAAATILANIEVLMLVEAFGLEMTLGNILFGSTFLATDILSELYGRESADKAVKVGIAASVTMLIVTQSWFLYTPASGDFASENIRALFTNTPRMLLVSLAVFAIVQKLDVWLYHKIWSFTERKTGDRRALLWLRNNGATLISQLVNAFLFNFGAFAGIYEVGTILEIVASSLAIFVVTSLADTPFLYLARRIHEKKVKNG